MNLKIPLFWLELGNLNPIRNSGFITRRFSLCILLNEDEHKLFINNWITIQCWEEGIVNGRFLGENFMVILKMRNFASITKSHYEL